MTWHSEPCASLTAITLKKAAIFIDSATSARRIPYPYKRQTPRNSFKIWSSHQYTDKNFNKKGSSRFLFDGIHWAKYEARRQTDRDGKNVHNWSGSAEKTLQKVDL